MHIFRVACFCLLADILFISTADNAQAADNSQFDILCEHAPKGDVIPLPSLVRDWVTTICTPYGQALAPELNAKGLWIVAATGEAFMLDAAPRSWSRPPSLTSYDIRFSDFAAEEREGSAKDMLLNMFDAAFKISPRPDIDRIIQLDARSVYLGTVYNLFFFIAQNRPQWIIVCRDKCSKAVPLNVTYALDGPNR